MDYGKNKFKDLFPFLNINDDTLRLIPLLFTQIIMED